MKSKILFALGVSGSLLLAVCFQGPPTPAPPPVAATPFASGAKPKTPRTDIPDAKAESVVKILSTIEALERSEIRDENDQKNRKVSFELPEVYINEYLLYSLNKQPRPGINAAKVSLEKDNNITVVASVDFGTLARWPEMMAAPLGLVGEQDLEAKLHFVVEDNKVRIEVRSIRAMGGTSPTHSLMLGMLSTIAAHQPEMFEVSHPIPLPYGLKRIWTDDKVLGGTTY